MHTLWTLKGGSGVTVVSALLASTMARRHGPTLLVDLAGDQPAALGLAEPSGPGVLDWLASDAAPDALRHLVVDVGQRWTLLPRGGAAAWPAERADELRRALGSLGARVVVDGGTIGVGASGDDPALGLTMHLAAGGRSLLVVRACYLALRRCRQQLDHGPASLRPDGLVLVEEDGRAIGAPEVAAALGLSVCATLRHDPDLSRAVDSGLLASRGPRGQRSLHRALDSLASA
jgi:hypothetical protein